jgi:streptogramin lyase
MGSGFYLPPALARGCLRAAVLLCVPMALAGCGIGTVTHSTGGTLALSGVVHGGQNPVAQSSIQLYTVGKAGNGSMSHAMLTAARSTATDGSFNITGDYSCGAADDQVYIVASGGNPGLKAGTDNPALVLMTALGSCGNVPQMSFIEINEVTTAAAAWALAPFIASAAYIGASSTNVSGIASAFLNAKLLADPSTGMAATLPSNLSVETGKLYALADALAPCVNSTGAGTPGCDTLFAAATPQGGTAPSNTLNAALSIVQHPGQYVMAVFQAITAQAPFPTTLIHQPNDWTMSLTVTGGGLDNPSALGVDGFNNVWVANYPGSLSAFTAQGTPLKNSPYGAGYLSEVYGLAVDGHNNIWLTNEEQPYHDPTAGSVTAFLGAGSSAPGSLLNGKSDYSDGSIDFPFSVAAAPNGDILIANFANSTATIYSDNGVFVKSGVGSGSASLPAAIAPDLFGGLWMADEGNNHVTHVSSSGTTLAYFDCCDGANGVATDKLGNAWIANFYGGTLSEISPAPDTSSVAVTATGGGMDGNGPSGIAVDAGQNVWVTNYYGANFTEIAGNSSSGTLAAGDAISPITGYGLDANLVEPFAIAPDAAGNLWISNFGNASLTMFFGLATPTVTPLLPTPTPP